MNIKLKAQLILLPTVLITTVLAAWSSYGGSVAMLDAAKQRELRTTATLIQNSIQEQSNKAAARANIIADLPSIQEAFRAQDREQLVKRLVPAFTAQRDQYGVREAQFHLAPAISFLRLYTPTEGHGEDLSGFREMVLAANRRQEPQKGVEIGRRGLSIRGMSVVRDAQGPIGSFEVGLSFSTVLTDAKRNTGFEAGVFVDDATMTRVATMVPRPDGERVIGGLQNVEATNWQAIRALVTPDMLRATTDIAFRTPTVGGVDYGVAVVPLVDFKGSPIGAVVATRSFVELQTQRQAALVRVAALALVQAVLLTGAVLLVLNALLLRPIASLSEKIARISKSDDATPGIAELAKHDDEVGRMAKGLEALERSLSEQRRAAKQARSDA